MKNLLPSMLSLLAVIMFTTNFFAQEIVSNKGVEEQSKEEWIKENPEKYQEIIRKSQEGFSNKGTNNSDIPVLIDTGNPELDTQNYLKAKKEWVAKNPEAYSEKVNSQNGNVQPEINRRSVKPVKENTGNPELDEQNFQIAKKAWIAENPDLYAVTPSTTEISTEKASPLRIFTLNEQELNESFLYSSKEEVKTFVREILESEQPSDFVTPEYVLNAENADSAGEIIGSKYPEFFGKQGAEYIDAVKYNPALFIRMVNEFKSVRLTFEPTN